MLTRRNLGVVETREKTCREPRLSLATHKPHFAWLHWPDAKGYPVHLIHEHQVFIVKFTMNTLAHII